MPDSLDLAFVAFFAIGLTLYAYFAGWPRMRRLLGSGTPGARVRVYRIVIVVQWLVAIAGWLLLRRHHGRARTLHLVAPHGLALGLGIFVIVAIGVLLAAQYRGIARLSAERRAAFQARLGGVGLILPRNATELRWFFLVALTAGVCEEFLYRGFALWVLYPWLGFAGAATVSTLLFGAGHGYQGRGGALRATVLAAAFVGLLVVTRSILPGMVLHTLIDIGGGLAGWAAFRDRPVEPAVPAEG